MSIGAVKTDSNAVKAKEPSDAFVSDGTFRYPVGHPLYFTELLADGTLLLNLQNSELSEFRVSVDRNINIKLYKHKEGARFRLFIYRSTADSITISFELLTETFDISGKADGDVTVLNIEIVKVNGVLKPLIVDDIDDEVTSPTETWSSQKIQAELDNVVLGTSNHTSDKDNPHSVTKDQIGLGNADNTADTDKPVSIAQQTALNSKADLVGGVVPSAQLPAFVDDVLEYDTFANFSVTGETGKIYVAQDTNITYRWGGSAYVEISSSLALGETESTAYRGDRGKTAYDLSHSHINKTLLDTVTEEILKHESITIACSDETSDLETGTGIVEFQMPFAMTVTNVIATLTTATDGSALIVDINEGGASILSTPLSIDSVEKTSTTAATPVVISDNSLAANSIITIDIDQIGATTPGAGLKVQLIGYRQ